MAADDRRLQSNVTYVNKHVNKQYRDTGIINKAQIGPEITFVLLYRSLSEKILRHRHLI